MGRIKQGFIQFANETFKSCKKKTQSFTLKFTSSNKSTPH